MYKYITCLIVLGSTLFAFSGDQNLTKNAKDICVDNIKMVLLDNDHSNDIILSGALSGCQSEITRLSKKDKVSFLIILNNLRTDIEKLIQASPDEDSLTVGCDQIMTIIEDQNFFNSLKICHLFEQEGCMQDLNFAQKNVIYNSLTVKLREENRKHQEITG